MFLTLGFVSNTIVMYFQVSANGNVLRSEIVGAIKMRVYLSGMPELRLGLNDKVLFESTGRKCSTLNLSQNTSNYTSHKHILGVYRNHNVCLNFMYGQLNGCAWMRIKSVWTSSMEITCSVRRGILLWFGSQYSRHSLYLDTPDMSTYL